MVDGDDCCSRSGHVPGLGRPVSGPVSPRFCVVVPVHAVRALRRAPGKAPDVPDRASEGARWMARVAESTTAVNHRVRCVWGGRGESTPVPLLRHETELLRRSGRMRADRGP